MTRFVVLALLLASTVAAWAADVVVVEDWKSQKVGVKGIPEGWQGGQTWGLPQYDMTVVENDGHRVLHLKSKVESSTISKDIKGKVNLKQTPILEWSWRVVELPKGANAAKKSTDDEAAQIYVTWPHFPQAFRSRIIGYIWDATSPVGSFVPSEKTGMVHYVVVRTGTAELGKWFTERRNVVDDYVKVYGEQPENPGVISVAIDSDDTLSSAESFFGAILFRKP